MKGRVNNVPGEPGLPALPFFLERTWDSARCWGNHQQSPGLEERVPFHGLGGLTGVLSHGGGVTFHRGGHLETHDGHGLNIGLLPCGLRSGGKFQVNCRLAVVLPASGMFTPLFL